HFLIDAEDLSTAEAVARQVLPLVDAIVPRLAPRGAQLQVVEHRDVLTEERLFRDAPSRRDAGEEAEALVGREDVRAVVARDQLEQVLVLEGVVKTGEVVLPRRHVLGTVVVLPEVAAGKDLIDLIRDEVPAECIDLRAVLSLALDDTQDVIRYQTRVA